MEEEKWSRGVVFQDRQKKVCGERKEEEWGPARGLGMDRQADLDQSHLDHPVSEQ